MAETEYSEYLEEHIAKNKKLYASGVLKPVVHHRLVGNIEVHAKTAGVSPLDIAAPFSETCATNEELAYVVHCIKQEIGKINGLYYVGDMDPPIFDRHKIFAGTILRHFRTVKLISQNLFFDLKHESFDFGKFHTLCVPDLMHNIIQLGDWHKRAVGGLITDRYIDGQQLILGRLATPKDMENIFGSDIVGIIKNHYLRINQHGE